MTEKQQQSAARAFARRWAGRGSEKSEDQSFWTELLAEVFGIERPTDYIRFQKPVKSGSTQFIDAYIPSTRVLIEQKSLGKSLDTREAETGHNAYAQALNYANKMIFSEKPRWIVTSNFAEMRIYDMDKPENLRQPVKVALADLGREYKKLAFLVDTRSDRLINEEMISVKAIKLKQPLSHTIRWFIFIYPALVKAKAI